MFKNFASTILVTAVIGGGGHGDHEGGHAHDEVVPPTKQVDRKAAWASIFKATKVCEKEVEAVVAKLEGKAKETTTLKLKAYTKLRNSAWKHMQLTKSLKKKVNAAFCKKGKKINTCNRAVGKSTVGQHDWVSYAAMTKISESFKALPKDADTGKMTPNCSKVFNNYLDLVLNNPGVDCDKMTKKVKKANPTWWRECEDRHLGL